MTTPTPQIVVHTNPNEFKGYPVDVLRGLKGLGPAIVGDDALHAIAVEYNESAVPGASGSVFGPALLTADARTVVTSSTVHTVPDSVRPEPKTPAKESTPSDSDDPWEKYDLGELLELVRVNNIDVPGRVKTPGKLIAALEAAGVKP